MPQRGSAEVFVATPEVYLRAYTHRTDSVWADGGTPERVTREVPLDVALAGAPRRTVGLGTDHRTWPTSARA